VTHTLVETLVENISDGSQIWDKTIKPWLLLDVSYLAYRAFFATPNLVYDEIPTSVAYGVFRDVLQLLEMFDTTKIAFCFDHGKPLRSLDWPEYKSGRRKNKTDEQKEAIALVKQQIKAMRREYLPALGFTNILYQNGYEADDVIAKVVLDRPKKNFVIVSSDQDLYQLLSSRVSLWNPHAKQLWTEDLFSKLKGVTPSQWVDVKAMAGCATDDIKGIVGVGEKTACRFLNGALDPKSAAYTKCVKGNKIWRRNMILVRLPYPEIQAFPLAPSENTQEKWLPVLRKLGIKSLPGLKRAGEKFTRATLGRK